MITNPACTGPGTGTAGSFTLPADGGGISYSKADNVVTATADSTHKFVSLPHGWTLVDAHHATYTVTLASPGGLPGVPRRAAHAGAAGGLRADCDTDGDLVVGTTPHVVIRRSTTCRHPDDPRRSGQPRAELHGRDRVHLLRRHRPKTFPVEVLGQDPRLPGDAGQPDGDPVRVHRSRDDSDPVVTFGDVEGDHITYAYDDQTHVVTATPDFGYVLVDLPEGWVAGEGSATFVVDLVDPGACLVETTVVSPSVTQSVCTGNGTKSDPVVTLGDVEGDHVSYVYDASSHVVTASPDQGFELADLPTGWSGEENGTATFQVVLTDPGSCAVIVSPPTTPTHTHVHVPSTLPNTGGPNQWLAASGLVLLLGGALLVAADRRRRAAVTLDEE